LLMEKLEIRMPSIDHFVPIAVTVDTLPGQATQQPVEHLRRYINENAFSQTREHRKYKNDPVMQMQLEFPQRQDD